MSVDIILNQEFADQTILLVHHINLQNIPKNVSHAFLDIHSQLIDLDALDKHQAASTMNKEYVIVAELLSPLMVNSVLFMDALSTVKLDVMNVSTLHLHRTTDVLFLSVMFTITQ